MSELADNYHRVQARIAAAAQRTGRDPADIILVAVSKSQPLAKVQALFQQTGHQHYGENRVPEGSDKVQAAQHFDPAGATRWHFIGNIQRRKVEAIIANFAMVHAVDRLSIAQRLSRKAQALNRELAVLIECNVSGEASKAGLPAGRWATDEAQWAALTATIAAIVGLPGLQVKGLMTMAPIVSVPEEARPIFVALRQLRDRLAQQFPQVGWEHLSMGMTNDFEVAVEEGATMVRVGRAIFGERLPN